MPLEEPFAVFEGVSEGCKVFQPQLDTHILFDKCRLARLWRAVWSEKIELGIDQKITAETLNASKLLHSLRLESGGVEGSSMSRVARLVKTIGLTEPSGCSYSDVASKRSTLTWQYE